VPRLLDAVARRLGVALAGSTRHRGTAVDRRIAVARRTADTQQGDAVADHMVRERKATRCSRAGDRHVVERWRAARRTRRAAKAQGARRGDRSLGFGRRLAPATSLYDAPRERPHHGN